MELLVVLGIIALLVGILLPALTIVQKTAKETKQKAQISHIEFALTAFKIDDGDYPPSPSNIPDPRDDYCGAQMLAEAILGWDLLGFHPRSDYRADGLNGDGVFIYNPDDSVLFDQRKGPYLDSQSANAFRLGYISSDKPGLYNDASPLAPDTFVICDVFGNQRLKLTNGRTVSAGSPILYYRANTSTSENTIFDIYKYQDNDAIVQIKERADDRGGGRHPLGRSDNNYEAFYNFIRDPKIEARAWPYRPDSYILISAGADGIYGTSDDIRNFGN